MIIKYMPLGLYQANCYILTDESTMETALVDPGAESGVIFNTLKNINIMPKFILLTHGHSDHTGAVDELCNKFNIPVYINEKDEAFINNNAYMFGPLTSRKDLIKNVKDGDIIKLGNSKIKCIETPGHTQGGVSYSFDNYVLTGDTLFHGAIGRTDLPGGDPVQIISSIKNKLMTLQEGTIILTGHGDFTNIGTEKNSNTFLR